MIDWFSQQQTNTLLPEFMPADRTTADVPPVGLLPFAHECHLEHP